MPLMFDPYFIAVGAFSDLGGTHWGQQVTERAPKNRTFKTMIGYVFPYIFSKPIVFSVLAIQTTN